ncbi:hypothetical protein D9M68_881420 [compost metagenome]
MLAYVRMLSAHLDQSGRTTAAIGAADTMGMVVGPLIATSTLNLEASWSALSNYGLTIQLICIATTLAFFMSTSRSKLGVDDVARIFIRL